MFVYQTENYGKAYEYRSKTHHNWIMPPHIHEFSELVYCTSGVMTVKIDGKTYELPKNHAALILPNQIHEYIHSYNNNVRCSVFSNDFVPLFYQKTQGFEFEYPIVDFSSSKYILNLFEDVDVTDKIKLCGILNIFCSHFLNNTKLIKRQMGDHNLFFDVVFYVSNNFRENITLKEIADKLGYNEKYLSSTLNSLTKMNFRTFLASYRIGYAKQLLSTSKQYTISQIAFESGFSSVNSFNRIFKDISGMTPSKFRKSRT